MGCGRHRLRELPIHRSIVAGRYLVVEGEGIRPLADNVHLSRIRQIDSPVQSHHVCFRELQETVRVAPRIRGADELFGDVEHARRRNGLRERHAWIRQRPRLEPTQVLLPCDRYAHRISWNEGIARDEDPGREGC